MKKHFNITVSGKVQGVFYRASAKNKAIELGITGFVQNLQNGKVFIEAEGKEEDLQQFIEWTKVGPAEAEVQKVEWTEDQVKEFKNFEVRR